MTVGQIVRSLPSLHLEDSHRNHVRRHYEQSQHPRYGRVEQASAYQRVDEAVGHIAQQQQSESEQGVDVQNVAIPEHHRVDHTECQECK
jgi:hypothetical protein